MQQQSIHDCRLMVTGVNEANKTMASDSLRLPSMEQSLAPDGVHGNDPTPLLRNAYRETLTDTAPPVEAENSMTERSYGAQPAQFQNQISIQSLLQPNIEDHSSRKRSHSEFELQEEPISDVVTKGLITAERAMFYFKTYVLAVFVLTLWY